MEWFCPECCTWTSDPQSDGCYHERADDPTSPWICVDCGGKLREAKDGLEYVGGVWDSPESLHRVVDDPDKVPMLRATYPHATTWEWCQYCDSEVVIPAYRESKCPVCDSPIIPCSMCATSDGLFCCHDKCPYSKEGSE